MASFPSSTARERPRDYLIPIFFGVFKGRKYKKPAVWQTGLLTTWRSFIFLGFVSLLKGALALGFQIGFKKLLPVKLIAPVAIEHTYALVFAFRRTAPHVEAVFRYRSVPHPCSARCTPERHCSTGVWCHAHLGQCFRLTRAELLHLKNIRT